MAVVLWDSTKSVFLLDDTTNTQRILTPYIRNIRGLPGVRDLNEATALGATGQAWHPTLEKVTIFLDLMWSADALVGPDTVLGPLRTHTAVVDFEYGPQGSTSTYIKYSGKCWVRNYEITTQIGTLVFAIAELPVEGAVGRTTF